VTAAFLASLVEAVEALTIVLAVATVRGWRPAGLGALLGLGLLAIIVVALGPLLEKVPLYLLQMTIGILLLLFGMRWLRKAILRSAGVIPLHDEVKTFSAETAELRKQARRHEARLDWIAGLASFKAVLLEGLEVVFIVIALGAGRGMLGPTSVGALAACLLVAAVGVVIRQPLARVPENTLKFAVGVMLSAFGIFWTGVKMEYRQLATGSDESQAINAQMHHNETMVAIGVRQCGYIGRASRRPNLSAAASSAKHCRQVYSLSQKYAGKKL